MPSSRRPRSGEVQKVKKAHAAKQLEYSDTASSSLPQPESNSQSPVHKDYRLSKEDIKRHRQIKKQLTNDVYSQLPDPKLFSHSYQEQDHQDLIRAFQQILQNNEQQHLLQLNDQLNQQVQEMLQLQLNYQTVVKPLNEQIQQDMVQLLKEQQNQDKYKKTVQRIVEQQAHMFEQLTKIIQQQLDNTQNQQQQQSKLEQLQQQISQYQATLQQKYASQEMDLGQIASKQQQLMCIYQIFTDIQIAQGMTTTDLIRWQQRLQKLQEATRFDRAFYIFKNDIDQVNYQAQLTLSGDADASLPQQNCTLETTQVPRNVIQDPSVLEMFEGSTETECVYLKLVYQQLCREFVRYDVKQLQSRGELTH